MQQIFPVHTRLEVFVNTTITSHFGFVFEDNLVREMHNYRDYIVFKVFSAVHMH